MNSKNTVSESVKDIKISWILFKNNIRAFFATEIFAAASAFMIMAIFFTILFLLDIKNDNLFIIAASTVFISVIIIFNVFLTSQFGLAYDILSSGNMYAEFKGAFVYFRKSWWRYLLYILMFNLVQPSTYIPVYSQHGNNIDISVTYYFIGFIIDFLGYILLINILPGISNHNSLKLAIHENFKLLSKYPKRIFITWSIFYIIFEIPYIIFRTTEFFGNKPDENINLAFFIPMMLIAILVEMIKFPLSALISTRLYNLLEEVE